MSQRSNANTISTPTTTGVAESIRIPNERLVAVRQLVALPTTLRGFLLFALGLLLVATGIMLQILLSLQIHTTKVAIADVAYTAELHEKRNAELIWAIADATSVEAIRRRALRLGFAPIEQPFFLKRDAQAGLAWAPTAVQPAPVQEVVFEGSTQVSGADPMARSSTTNSDELWTSGLVTQARSTTAQVIRSWIDRE